MNKICTTREQSQKLIELGIDANTADMVWVCGRLHTDGPKYQVLRVKEEVSEPENYIPAWSLAALLELIDKNISNVSLEYDGSEWFIIYEGREEYEYKSFVSTCPLDAAFEMVCFLLKK